MRPSFYRPARARPQRSTIDAYALLLIFNLLQRVMDSEYKPPVTLALLAANLMLHFGQEVLYGVVPPHLVPTVPEACLHPRRVVERGEWKRLFLSGFLHADAMHVYYNMSSLLWKGLQLERLYGSVGFGLLVGEMLVLSHAITVLLALVLAEVPSYAYMYDTCAIGFSAVLFGLKVILNHNSPDYSTVYGFTIPTKYVCWAELVLASVFNPRASFLGHLAGILAGLLHVKVLAPALTRAGFDLAAWGRSASARFAAGRSQQQQQQQPRRRAPNTNWGSGRVGGQGEGVSGHGASGGSSGAAAGAAGGGGAGGRAAGGPGSGRPVGATALPRAGQNGLQVGGSAAAVGATEAPGRQNAGAAGAAGRVAGSSGNGGQAGAAPTAEELRRRRLARFG